MSRMMKPTETSKQPIKTRYLGHVTVYQPIRDQYFLIRSVPTIHLSTIGRSRTRHHLNRETAKYVANSARFYPTSWCHVRFSKLHHLFGRRTCKMMVLYLPSGGKSPPPSRRSGQWGCRRYVYLIQDDRVGDLLHQFLCYCNVRLLTIKCSRGRCTDDLSSKGPQNSHLRRRCYRASLYIFYMFYDGAVCRLDTAERTTLTTSTYNRDSMWEYTPTLNLYYKLKSLNHHSYQLNCDGNHIIDVDRGENNHPAKPGGLSKSPYLRRTQWLTTPI
eukprot:sb/3468098/